MLSLTRVVATRTTSLMAPKAVAASGISTRMFSIADDLAKKTKVEEDRYIRSKEHEDYLKRKAAEPAPSMTAEELAADRAHAAAVDEAFEILSKTGCAVKDETIEALASWKLGK